MQSEFSKSSIDHIEATKVFSILQSYQYTVSQAITKVIFVFWIVFFVLDLRSNKQKYSEHKGF